MNHSENKEIVIRGITSNGRTLRPSNWAERLAGVVSQFRPQPAQLRDHLSYSPWCMPGVDDGVKCVVVNTELQKRFPQAWEYVQQFARENDLQTYERDAAASTSQ